MHITLDTSLLIEENIGPNGLSRTQIENPELESTFIKVNEDIKNKKYGFINLLEDKDLLKDCKKVFEEISWAKRMIVVGIGGSDLGGRMLKQGLETENPPMEVIFTGDTTDPLVYNQLLKNIDPDQTVIVVVSKSGSTTETAVGYLVFKEFFKEKIGTKWYKHFVFITDEKDGILRAEASTLGITTLPIPADVGGRFSVLSAVGLLPALAMGINIGNLLAGANVFTQLLVSTPTNRNAAWQIALFQYLYQKEKGINTVVIIPYIAKLELFAVWFRQLWAESLGKDGKGILPIKAIGPADQHSQVQFYNQGTWLSTFLFISQRLYPGEITVVNSEIEELKYLNNTDLDDIIKAECEATRYSLASSGRPSAHLEIETLDEIHLGVLIVLFELAVVYLAELLKVNAFDQPGVEAGKEYMYGLLGRKGFEDKAKEIEDKKNGQVKRVVTYQS
ncbi:MAG: hypothetical protein ACOX6V_01180 [Patescibacteria group bacterium]|jgi:glucose-6-phosphate isomerase